MKRKDGQPRNQTPTKRQMKMAELFVKGDYDTKKDLLMKSGYSEMMATGRAIYTLEQNGFKRALVKLGFDEDSAKSVIAKILQDEEAKDRDRISAAQEIFKVLGSYAPDKSVTLQARVDVSDQKVEELRKEYEDKLKELVVEKLNAPVA